MSEERGNFVQNELALDSVGLAHRASKSRVQFVVDLSLVVGGDSPWSLVKGVDLFIDNRLHLYIS